MIAMGADIGIKDELGESALDKAYSIPKDSLEKQDMISMPGPRGADLHIQ